MPSACHKQPGMLTQLLNNGCAVVCAEHPTRGHLGATQLNNTSSAQQNEAACISMRLSETLQAHTGICSRRTAHILTLHTTTHPPRSQKRMHTSKSPCGDALSCPLQTPLHNSPRHSCSGGTVRAALQSLCQQTILSVTHTAYGCH
jgi:hypothetical protein